MHASRASVRRRPAGLLTVFLAGVLLAACGGGESVAPVNKGSIQGTVTDNSGAIVPYATVRLTATGQLDRITNSGASRSLNNAITGTTTLAGNIFLSESNSNARTFTIGSSRLA